MLSGMMAALVWQGQDVVSRHDRLLMIFIGVAATALLGQALVMMVLAAGAFKTQKHIMEQIEEMKAKVLPLLAKSDALVTDLAPQLKAIAAHGSKISDNVEEISGLVRVKLHEFGPTISAANETLVQANLVVREANETVRDANRKTQAQILRVNGMVTSVLDATAQAGKAIQRGIEVPVHQAGNLLDAAKVAFGTFLNGRARPRPYRPPVGTYEPPRDREL
jgi:hypothetical protein